jgi:hypothetical protein
MESTDLVGSFGLIREVAVRKNACRCTVGRDTAFDKNFVFSRLYVNGDCRSITNVYEAMMDD